MFFTFRGSFASVENEAKVLTECDPYEDEYRRPKKRNKRYDENSIDDHSVSPSEKFETKTHNAILDCLHSELTKRQKACNLQTVKRFIQHFQRFASADSSRVERKDKKSHFVLPR